MRTMHVLEAVSVRRPLWSLMATGLAIMVLGGETRASVSPESLYDAMPLQTVMSTAGGDERVLRDFYDSRGYRLIWLGHDTASSQRLHALTVALDGAESHGIPTELVMRDALHGLVIDHRDPFAVAQADAAISRIYLNYAQILSNGLLKPSEVSELIAVRKMSDRDDLDHLTGITGPNPTEYLAGLAPQEPAYQAMRATLQSMREVTAGGGWGQIVQADHQLMPGESGEAVIALRNRLIRMGYLPRTSSPDYDLYLMQAVQAFQVEHGLEMTGIADAYTLDAINVSAEERIQQLISSLERMRWNVIRPAEKKIIVNIPEFKARIYAGDDVLFESNVVVGKTDDDLQTPEFSDYMEYVVINPDWNVPYSIITEEILPEVISGRNDWLEVEFLNKDRIPIDRSEIDFSAFREGGGFPFRARQLPGPTNPLGTVKFMFPNRHNIYLHDSPMRDFFTRQIRTYSHGCVRVMEAASLARQLLVHQGVDYDGLIRATRGTDDQVHVYLQEHIPVHITYQSVVHRDGRITFRNDIYGRDKLIYETIVNSGIVNEDIEQDQAAG
ncbi:MAG: L,D-transpeptidase family protein [Rhodobacteraceae bacterium]|nr:L,D-transpeptidase family protein [Paracoccaceae bacterium]